MFRARAGASRGLRSGIFALVSIAAVMAVTADNAEARYRHRRHGVRTWYQPPYAALVVDANSGEALYENNADSLRHPASITKIMTLYLLFEQIEAGKISLDTPMEVSNEAASQAPSKLGLRPGQTILTEHAIKALVTKSANDVAVVIAEALAGDEETFARMMTRKARGLGMTRTTYRNASGLPDEDQVTTARDQALLGRAIQDRFPRFYRYFSTASFSYRGRAMRNHNHLLGRVDGLDGIKTGYTRDSGFNLVASVRRNGRHVVAVVLGGRSAGARDTRMRALIEEYIDEGSARRTVARITDPSDEGRAKSQTVVASAAPIERTEMAGGPVALPSHPLPGSAEPIKPVPVKTLSVRPAAAQASALPQLASMFPGSTPAPAQAPAATRKEHGAAGLGRRESGSSPAAQSDSVQINPTSAYADEIPGASGRAGGSGKADIRRGGWVIQIGAFPEETEAKQRLQSAMSAAKPVLGTADPFTEPVTKGQRTLYRARFAGFDRDRAEAACKYLKRSEFACFALKN